jgi:uncharacterized membrane protein
MAQIIVRLRPADPNLILAFALLLNLLIVGFSVWAQRPGLSAIAFAGTVFLEITWFANSRASVAALAWFTGYALLFTALPFALRKYTGSNLTLWRLSAAASPVHFFLIYAAARALWPGFTWPGLYPALLAIPALASLATVRREEEPARRMQLVSLYGASVLFFLTLIFPIQFDREWLTLGWAFEGVALIWLYRRAPVAWVLYLGSVLLAISFARLAFNPAVLEYHQRGSLRVINWYLYAYGCVAAAQFGAAFLSRADERSLRLRLRPLGNVFGTVLLFLLLNIEIADFFAAGPYLAFDFSGNLARDMSYSIAWSLFALALLVIGVKRNLKPVRYAGIGLMLVTLAKLFLHDLSTLGSLYRIGAFIAVAIILILASWIYQRFLANVSAQSDPP